MGNDDTSSATGGSKLQALSFLWSIRFLVLYAGIVALGYSLYKLWFDECCETFSDLWIQFTVSFVLLAIAIVWIVRVWMKNRDARLIAEATEKKEKPEMSPEDLDVAIREQRKELETMYMQRKKAELLLQADKLNARIRQRDFA